jgi:glycosyltransferase involved in cell wall biosynthesis
VDRQVGRTEVGESGETILRTGYLPHRGDIITRTADHLVAAADAVRLLLNRFSHRAHRPDVIIASAPAIESLVAGELLSRLWKVPFVAEMRDAWPDLVTELGPETALPPEQVLDQRVSTTRRALKMGIGGAKSVVHRQVTRWQRSANHVVTTTVRFAEVLRGRGVHGVDVVRNGTDASAVEQHSDPDPDRPTLRCLYLGNMGRSQGLDAVVRAAARLHAEGVPLEVRMIGHGVDAVHLSHLARDLRAPVEVRPRIPHNKVDEQFCWADTVIVSLRDWPPFAWTVPSKLYEVLATGRHITALLDGEAADVVRSAQAGDVVPPEDVNALVDLWRDLQADRGRLAARQSGREWVTTHADDDVLASRYLEILAEVVGARA